MRRLRAWKMSVGIGGEILLGGRRTEPVAREDEVIISTIELEQRFLVDERWG